MRISAPAKLNLALDVGHRRPDGYHEVATVLHALDLADEVVLRPAGSLSLKVEGPFAAEAPPGAENLAWRAAETLGTALGRSAGVAIQLTKRIPAGAGLGGGSADAAAVLMGLDRLWDAGRGATALAALAADLGSDVPFFLAGGTALATGRGERLRPLPDRGPYWFVLAVPDFACPTGAVYDAFDRLPAAPPARRAEALASRLITGDAGPEELAALLGNDLTEAAVAVRPELAGYLAAVRRAGVLAAQISGSGSAVFGLCRDRPAARRAAAALEVSDLCLRQVTVACSRKQPVRSGG